MSFKIAHLSDLHLEYRSTRKTNNQGLNVREVDGYIAFAQCVQQVINEGCDVALVAGDTFHAPHPSPRAIIFAQKQFRKLADAGIKVYILGGNHDISDIATDLSAAKILDDPYRGIFSSAEPYVRHEITDGIYLHLVSHHMYSQQAQTFAEVQAVPDSLNIFSTHGSCIDPILQMKLHTEQSPREIVIPDFLLEDKDWSYTMLGHIHERGWVGSRDKKTDTSGKKVYYNGSTIRRGFSDKKVPLGRGWTLWTIDSNGVFTPEHKTIAQRPQMDFKPINADELNASEITETIIERLKNTHGDNAAFNAKTAPILRQNIVNIDPVKYSSLDWSSINHNSEHALQWRVNQVHKEIDSTNDDATQNDTIIQSGDIVQVYDDWIDKTTLLSEMKDDIRKTITSQGRDFVQLGQETALDAE